ncbi:MAG TPA: acyltransferase [Gemmatales bacterium]|nr:acyltransferase [Gemmatales bacterium]
MLAHLFVFPLLLWHWLWIPVLGADRSVQGSTEFLSLIPGIFGNYLRNAFLTWTIKHCHPSATLSFGTTFSKANASIGKLVYIGPGCHLGMVDIQRDVLVAAGVHITSGARTHGFADDNKPIRDQEGTLEVVTIGENSWIGSAAIVMADVGKNTIIGAGAVVTKPIPDNVVAVGIPAKVIQQRFKQ